MAQKMAVSLGKRKRERREEAPESGSEDDQDMRARFQKAFEAKFKPLERNSAPPMKDEAPAPSDMDGGGDTSDWTGFSDDDDDEDDNGVQVIAHNAAHGDFPEVDRSQQRAYMSSKPPTSNSSPASVRPKQKDVSEEEDRSESANLKNDLALQRLLKESHLLDSSTFSGKSSAPEGKGRLKALDLRLQDLGAKSSFFNQDRMPIAHRKGIQSKAVEKERRRRKEAAENGVILEMKARDGNSGHKKDVKRRDRSVGGPTVGKFKGGTLRLSGKDLKDIQGPKGQGKVKTSRI